MSFPQSFSTTAECPFMTSTPSASAVTVRLSSSATPIASRRVSTSNDKEAARRSVPSSLVRSATTSASLSPRRMSNEMSATGLANSKFLLCIQKSRSQVMLPTPVISKVNAPAESFSWWNPANVFPRPWEDDPDESASVPTEQKHVFAQTRDAICSTLKTICGVAGPIALEALVTGIKLMELCPIPALHVIAKTLISIWEAVQLVGMNRLAILRVTQMCTTILCAVHEEFARGGHVEDLAGPVAKLESSFEEFLVCLKTQVGIPFLMRYLRRDDTALKITACREQIIFAINQFQTTIQMRTLNAVVELTDVKFHGLVESLMPLLHNGRLRADSCPLVNEHPDSDSVGLSHTKSSMVEASPSENIVVTSLRDIQSSQLEEDSRSDVEDLRQMLRSVLLTGSDADLFNCLEIVREELPEALKTLQRTREATQKDGDTLHQEFIESGIDALRRLSADVDTNLPNWTITKYEITIDHGIGFTHFSNVYKGAWKGRTVAIKVLSEVTPSAVFLREMNVWKSLDHPNVLQLYGASSATAEPPWYFVSPYLKHGSLVQFLKRVSMHQSRREPEDLGPIAERLQRSTSRSGYGKIHRMVLKAGDVYRILQEVAKGMEYLHQNDTLHGDLKAANVLVDDNYRCVISDFGQSEMKSEVYRITGISGVVGGTLRWKAPELLEGASTLTQATDVYAFAILCIEVLAMGQVPWCLDDDESVRHFVLNLNKRPAIPADFSSPLLHDLIDTCWDKDPENRPSFTSIIAKFQQLRNGVSESDDLLYSPTVPEIIPEHGEMPLSPQMSPQSFSPTFTSTSQLFSDYSLSAQSSPITSMEEVSSPLHREETVSSLGMKMHEPVHYVLGRLMHSSKDDDDSEYAKTTASSDSLFDLSEINRGRHSPPPSNDILAEARNERRYRLLLEHQFHPSLTLPLWNPVYVQLGDVGYLSKPGGTFITLFNAFKPHKTSGGLTEGLPSLAGYGRVSKGIHRQDKRNVAQKGLDAVSGFLTFTSRSSDVLPISRRESFPLRAGHKCAHMYTESAEYQYMKMLTTPKAWFKANIDATLKIYGRDHNIQKEDILLVIGALQVQNYALFVSHKHPDGHAHFNVVSAQKKGRPWGTFTTDTSIPNWCGGPCYDEPIREESDSNSKISMVGEPQKSILLARLRFKPDAMEPTSL